MINNVVLMGRMTADPEIRSTGSGKTVANFTIAVDKFRREDGADFIRCVAWEKTADFISRYFGKGTMIAVVGSIQTRQFEDQSGNKRTLVEVVAREVSFCGGRNESQEKPKQNGSPADFEEIGGDDETDEDLPF